MNPRRPIVRYHGGKWLLAPWIISHFPKHRIYVEPFGGGGSVLLQKAPSYAEIYNDLAGEMVNLFRVGRDRGQELILKLQLTPFSREEFHLAYEPTDDELERARRTIVRSFQGMGSNGIYRKTGFRGCTRQTGTSPAKDWQTYVGHLARIVGRLQGVVIENRDATEVIEIHDTPDTLHYVDPPYPESTRDAGRDYQYEMSDDDHVRLAETLRSVEGFVIVSGYDCELYRDLYRDWHMTSKTALADKAQARKECLWMNTPGSQQNLFAEMV